MPGEDWRETSSGVICITKLSWLRLFNTEYWRYYAHGAASTNRDAASFTAEKKELVEGVYVSSGQSACRSAHAAPAQLGVSSCSRLWLSGFTGKWLFDWVLQLCCRDDCRLIVQGLKRADGNRKPQRKQRDRIVTSSPVFRDQLVVLLLHAGYAAYWTDGHRRGAEKGFKRLDGSDDVVYRDDEIDDLSQFRVISATQRQFVVNWLGPEAKGQTCVTPSLRKADVQPEPYSGRLWCVQVTHADHLIVAQRAVVDEQGSVLRASLPVIVGNCWTYETSVLLDLSLSNNIPNNDFIQYYGPDYHLHLQPSDIVNLNSRDDIERTRVRVLQMLSALEHAPSVQMQSIPPDWYLSSDEAAAEAAEDRELDVRDSERERDRRVEKDSDFYDGDTDQDRSPVKAETG